MVTVTVCVGLGTVVDLTRVILHGYGHCIGLGTAVDLISHSAWLQSLCGFGDSGRSDQSFCMVTVIVSVGFLVPLRKIW